MRVPFEALAALRYLGARRRNHFISFISLASMSGIAIGVLALITVLSVMNGFEKELLSRILAMTAHAAVTGDQGVGGDWRAAAATLERQEGVAAAAPFLRAEGMLVREGRVHGVALRGILPEEERKVSLAAQKMRVGRLDALRPGEFGMIIGAEVARSLGALPGAVVTLVAPRTGAGGLTLPRLRRFTIVGVFAVGMHEFDSGLALLHLEDAQALFQQPGPQGLRLKTNDIAQAPRISRRAAQALPDGYRVVDWTQRNASLFRALQTERTVMFVILALIIAVAAFNIVAALVMVVTDKQADIAVLRTLGAAPGEIMRIFILQGALIGVVGALAGALGGAWLAVNIEDAAMLVERLLGMELLSADVYYISGVPSELRWLDAGAAAALAVALSTGGAVYPAWRAAQTQPAAALRCE